MTDIVHNPESNGPFTLSVFYQDDRPEPASWVPQHFTSLPTREECTALVREWACGDEEEECWDVIDRDGHEVLSGAL